MSALSQVLLGNAGIPGKKPTKKYTQGGVELKTYQREMRNGNMQTIMQTPDYNKMTDTELNDYSVGMGRMHGGAARRVIAGRQVAATEQAAANQAAETTRARNEQQQAMLNLQRESQNLAANGGADLAADTTTANVVAGGTADSEGTNDAVLKKKKAAGSGMATQLGINV